MSFTSKIYTYHLQWLHASPPVVVCKVGSISESIFILFPFSESSTFSLYFSVHQMPTSNLEVLWVFFLQFDKRICSMAGFFQIATLKESIKLIQLKLLPIADIDIGHVNF